MKEMASHSSYSPMRRGNFLSRKRERAALFFPRSRRRERWIMRPRDIVYPVTSESRRGDERREGKHLRAKSVGEAVADNAGHAPDFRSYPVDD